MLKLVEEQITHEEYADAYRVYETTDGRFFMTTGQTDSYGTLEWNGDLKEVTRKEVTRPQYNYVEKY